MKKAIITTCLAALLLGILLKSGIFDSLLFFVLVGAIPGTDYSIPSTIMLLVIISIIWLTLFRTTIMKPVNTTVHRPTVHRRPAKHRTEHKKRTPKQRYERA